MGSKQLNFNDKIRRIPQKALGPEALSHGLIMVKMQVINPEWAGVWGYPYKYLPAMTVSSEKPSEMGTTFGKEGIVLPKGTIVSMVTNQTTISSGVPDPTASGTIPWFKDQLDNGNLITAPIDDTFFGYEESITGLLVPANGGAASTYVYSSLDTELDGWTKEGDPNLVLGANIPIGIVMKPVYQDIRGKYLNYQTHDAITPIINGRVDVPYVDTYKFNALTSEAFGDDAVVVPGTASAYLSLWRTWQWLAFDGDSDEGRSGNLLMSDKYGKFVVQAAGINENKTVQSVGRILTTDSRFPKNLEGTIQHYPGINTLMGVKTAGLPTDLYMFAKTALAAAGSPSAAADCLHAVQDGVFGFVRIQISCNR